MKLYKIDLNIFGKCIGVKKKFFESYKNYRERLLKILNEGTLVIEDDIRKIEIKGTIKL